MIDNRVTVILGKLNELAERHGLLAVEFCATLDSDDDGRRIITFVTPPSIPSKRQRFLQMLHDLDITDPDSLTLRDTDERLISILDRALCKRPPLRNR